jgi:hypothetical protein
LEAIKRSRNIAFTFNTNEDVGPDGYTVFLDDGNRVRESDKNEIILIDVAIPYGVTLESTSFSDNAFGYKARGFPVDSSFTDGSGVVKVFNDEWCYEVILQKTSGGLKLEGPKPKDECLE